jgi:hypothetical protein
MAIADTKPLRKPLTLNLVAAGYLGVMVLNIVQIYSQGRSIYPHDVLFLVLFPVAAYGIFKVRRWGWYLVIGHTLSLLIINVVLTVKFGYFFDQLFIQFNLLLLFFLWFFLRKSVRSPFHNPALRWWERQHSRYGATFRVTLRNESGDVVTGEGVNLSMGGCFIKLADDRNITTKDRFEVELRYDDFEPFHTKGRVTYIRPGSELGPKGAGIVFSRADRPNRLLLKAILKMVESRWIKSAESAPV